MIVANDGPDLIVVTQADHAQLSAALLSLWRADGLPEHPRRDDLLFAVREHDNGWQRADAAPRISPNTGRPTSFDRVSADSRLEIWRRSVRRHALKRPYPSLLILRHARAVNRRFWSAPGWSDFESELEALEKELLEECGIDEKQISADYAWLRLTDTLSLGGCGAFGGPGLFEGELRDYRFELGLGHIGLAPLPLAGATRLEISFRKLPNRVFSDDLDLASELATAVWRRRPIRIEHLAA